jgi:hypothetical protein
MVGNRLIKLIKRSILIMLLVFIAVSTADEMPVLLIDQGSSPPTNPTANANIDILTNVAGSDGYSTINTTTFLPTGLNLNNHYPLQDNVSDFLIFDLPIFGKVEENLNAYNADNGTITPTSSRGEQKEYLVSYSGFPQLHFDVYGIGEDSRGNGKKIVATWDWENNPVSHDCTAVPEPTTFLLLGVGILSLGIWFIWQKKIRK